MFTARLKETSRGKARRDIACRCILNGIDDHMYRSHSLAEKIGENSQAATL